MSRAYNDIIGLIDSIRADSTRVGVNATLARINDELSQLHSHCGIQLEDISGTRETGNWTAIPTIRAGLSLATFFEALRQLHMLKEEYGAGVQMYHGSVTVNPYETVSVPFMRSVSDIRKRKDYTWGYVEGGIAQVNVTQSLSSLVHCVKSLMEENGLSTGIILDKLYNCLGGDIDRESLKKKLNQRSQIVPFVPNVRKYRYLLHGLNASITT